MKILHLYHDVMNLYGEYGNMVLLTQVLNTCGIETELISHPLTEKPDFSAVDFLYMGAGTEENQKVVLTRLLNWQEKLKEYIFQEGYGLWTGNSFEILGNRIIDPQGKEWQGLGILPFTVRQQKKTRLTGDAILAVSEGKEPLVGFINKCSQIEKVESPCFQVLMGMGNEKGGNTEGIRCKNFLGTHLTGPMLVKNPYFLLEIVNDLVKKERKKDLTKEEKEALKEGLLAREVAAYEVTLRELKKRMENKK